VTVINNLQMIQDLCYAWTAWAKDAGAWMVIGLYGSMDLWYIVDMCVRIELCVAVLSISFL
jgi:hypothetical protein